MKGLKLAEFVIVVLISGLIGDMVALPFIFKNPGNMLLDLLGSFAVGMSIGSVSMIVFYFVFRNIRKYTYGTFCLLIIIIGSGTFLGAYLMGERDVLDFLIMILLAELIGNTMAAIIYRRATRINEQLKVVQKKLGQQK